MIGKILKKKAAGDSPAAGVVLIRIDSD